jgi:hypothetical protein
VLSDWAGLSNASAKNVITSMCLPRDVTGDIRSVVPRYYHGAYRPARDDQRDS